SQQLAPGVLDGFGVASFQGVGMKRDKVGKLPQLIGGQIAPSRDQVVAQRARALRTHRFGRDESEKSGGENSKTATIHLKLAPRPPARSTPSLKTAGRRTWQTSD